MASNLPSTGMQAMGPVRPPMIGHVGPPPNPPPPPMSMQYRHVVPPPPPLQPPFVQMGAPQFQPGGHSNIGMPPHPQNPQSVPLQPLQPQLKRPAPAQGPPPPIAQPQMVNFVPSFGGPRISHITYNLSSSSGGQEQQMNMVPTAQQRPMQQGVEQPWFSAGNKSMQLVMPMQQAVEQNGEEQIWLSSGAHHIKPVTPLQQNGEQNNAVAQHELPNGNQSVQTEEKSAGMGKYILFDHTKKVSSDWKEHTSRQGKKYYYNKRTKVSSWDKPLELMTANERADASTDWREVTTPEGRRFYYNKVAKLSKWAIPDEVKLARELANTTLFEGIPTIKDARDSFETSANNLSSPTQEMALSPVSVTPVVNNPDGASTLQDEVVVNLKPDAVEMQAPLEISTSAAEPDTPVPINTPMRISDVPPQEEADKNSDISESGDDSQSEGKKLEHEPLVIESKEEANDAFKDLLETANVGSDWNWEQAMRVIINDRRYGALRTLGERQRIFNEFVEQKKKEESDEKCAKEEKAREDFKKMLQESEDLTSSTRWSKAVFMFENDERFQAVERVKDRVDLFKDHLKELDEKALEEHKRRKTDYLEFLKSCDFIKASSQWRKLQHDLESDERCSRLEKMERFEIFQEYIRDLEMVEEETRKLRMEEMRKAERKNRDEFRKLMEEHVDSGILTPKSHWVDYCMKVKDAPAYMAVSSNTSGSNAKELFEDVIEDLEKQYVEDKEKIEEATKNEKISLSTSWTVEDFKSAIFKSLGAEPISYINLKLVFDELLEIAKAKEEKEAFKRKRLAEDVHNFLFASKEISSSSKWEDFKSLVEGRFNGEESFLRDIFIKFILELKENAKEKERKQKEEKARKERERKNRERQIKDRKNRDRGFDRRKGRERRNNICGNDSDGSESFDLEENKRSRDKSSSSRRHHNRHIDSLDDTSFDDEDKDRSRSRRRSVDSKRSKQLEKNAESGSQSKRHKRDHGDGGSGKNADREEQCKDDEDDQYVEVI